MKKPLHPFLTKYWWLMSLQGALGIFLGMAALLWMMALSGWLGRYWFNETFRVLDGTVFTVLVLLFIPSAFFDGILTVVLGAGDLGGNRRGWVFILEAVMAAVFCSLAFGLFTALHRGAGGDGWIWTLGGYALALGVFLMVMAGRFRRFA